MKVRISGTLVFQDICQQRDRVDGNSRPGAGAEDFTTRGTRRGKPSAQEASHGTDL